MSAEADRLLALLEEARGRLGDGVLADPPRLRAVLADGAPELSGQIRALALALGNGAAARVRQAADPAIAAAQEAAVIAAKAGLAPDQARAGLDAALRLGGVPAPLGCAAPGTPIPGHDAADWLGLSTLASTAAQSMAGPSAGRAQDWAGMSTPVQPSAPNPALDLAARARAVPPMGWLAGGVVALAVLSYFGTQNQAVPPPQPVPTLPVPPQPAPLRPVPPGPPQEAVPQVPILNDPRRPPPTPVPIRRTPNGLLLDFGVRARTGLLHVNILISPQGWDQATVAIGSMGAQQAETVSNVGAFRREAGDNGVLRGMVPRWERDGLGVGEICIGFQNPGSQATDVQLAGAILVMAASAGGHCNQVIGGGQVQSP